MDSLAGATHDFYEEADDRRKRRRLIVGAVLAALVLASAWFAFSMSKGDGAAGADGAAGTGAAHVPTITVLVDRKSVVWGKSVSVRVDLGGRRIIKKKK